ncbi:unnamed protein product [Rotaria sp. Silwood1]|nr:unnamed protein product [Rotaria sp. Silwood1]CAF1458559.1 unnamed protein product [Rotaria sp. Silwood1]
MVLYPKSSISDLCFWSQTYSSGTQYTPGSSEHASSPLVNRSTADQKLKRSSSSKRFLIKKRNKKDSKLKQQLVYISQRMNGEHYDIHESQPFCLNCYERETNYCDTCGERIETNQLQKVHESQHWHATDAYFYCYICHISLNNRHFFSTLW